MDKYAIKRLLSKMGVDGVGQGIDPAKGVRVKSPSRVRIPLSPPLSARGPGAAERYVVLLKADLGLISRVRRRRFSDGLREFRGNRFIALSLSHILPHIVTAHQLAGRASSRLPHVPQRHCE